MQTQLQLRFVDIEGDGAPIQNKQNYHLVASIEGETVVCLNCMQQESAFAVVDSSKNITLLIKEKDKEALDKTGSVSFPLSELITAFFNKKRSIWFTLFDEIDDDLYDGDYMEPDTEAPRVCLEILASKAANTPKIKKNEELEIDSLEKTNKFKMENQRSQSKDMQVNSTPEQPKIGDISSVYYSNNEKKPNLEDVNLMEDMDDAGIKKELDDNLKRQTKIVEAEIAPTLSNDQELEAINEIKIRVGEISSIMNDNQLKEQIEESNKIISALRKEAIIYKDKISKNESELKLLAQSNDTIPSLKKRLAQIEAQLDQYKKAESQASDAQKQQLDKISKIERELAATKKKNANDTEEMRVAHQEESKKLSEQIEEYDSQIKSLSQQIEEKSNELSDIKITYKTLEDEYTKLKQSSEELARKVDEGEKANRELMKKQDKITREAEEAAQNAKRIYDNKVNEYKIILEEANKAHEKERSDWEKRESSIKENSQEITNKCSRLAQSIEEQKVNYEKRLEEMRAKHDKIALDKELYASTMEENIQSLKSRLSEENLSNAIKEKINVVIELLNKLLESRKSYTLILKETKEKNEQLKQNLNQTLGKYSLEVERGKKLEEELRNLQEKSLKERQAISKEVEARNKEIERLNEKSIKARIMFEEFDSKMKEADLIHQKSKEKDEVINTLKKKLEDVERAYQKSNTNNLELQKENEILKGQILFRDEKLKSFEKEYAEKEKALYIPEASDKVDQMLAFYINQTQCPIKISKVGDGHYMFGTKKIFAKILNDRLVIRVGGGFMMIDEFLSIYTAQELAKIEKEEANSRNGSLSAQKSGELDYSGHTSPMAVPNNSKKIPIRSRSPIGSINGTNRARVLNETEIKNIKQLAQPKTSRIEKTINTKGSITSITTKKTIEEKQNEDE